MNRRSTPEADAQRVIVQALRLILGNATRMQVTQRQSPSGCETTYLVSPLQIGDNRAMRKTEPVLSKEPPLSGGSEMVSA